MRLGTCLVLLAVCVGAGRGGCSGGYFQCGRGGTCIGGWYCVDRVCIPSWKWCDTDADCSNRWDEERCGCGTGRFRCNNTCFSPDRTCDGVRDCQDGWDEDGCGSCNRGAEFCDNHCVVRCDGNQGCRDASDEKDCTSCNDNALLCENKKMCVRAGVRCDGIQHCPDGSDELHCSNCNGNAFLCSNNEQCVRAEVRCDGIQHCADGTDELHCSNCTGDGIHCGDHCVSPEHRCDGVSWCVNGLDEADCENMTANSNSTVCPAETRCNGVVADCDLNDEVDCSADMCRFPASRETFCDGQCLRADRMCNGVNDCANGSDEAKCEQCRAGAVFCDGACMASEHVCDGFRHCADGTDERNCSTCKYSSFLCDGDRCVRYRHRCDGVQWCRDGSDETHCNNRTAHSTACPAETRCNGLDGNCYTKDDEVGCSADMCRYPASNQTYCDGRCLLAYKWCDGNRDCFDLRDEKDCHGGASTLNSTNEHDAGSATSHSARGPSRCSGDPDCSAILDVTRAALSQMSHIAAVQNFTAFAFAVIAVVTIAMAAWKFRNRCRRPPQSRAIIASELREMDPDL